MPSMKISLLALASTAAAVPHYGANPHSKFHSLKASTGKAYPTGGWSGEYNSTAVPYPTGTGAYDDGKTTTLDQTSTSTQTLYSTVYVKPSASEATGVAVENASTGKCGPATVTVTASEKVTVTVTPGGGAGAPKSSAAAVESKHDNGYGAGVPSSSAVVSETPAAEKPTTSAAAEYPAETPKVEASTTPAAAYPAETPAAETATSAKSEYVAPSYAQKEPVAYSSAVAPSSAVASPSALPSAAPSTGNTYSGTKRGLAYNEASLCSSFGSKFGFGYNWGQEEKNDIGTGFIPMMHGPSKSTAEEWMLNVDKAVGKGSKAVMGFNECDHDAQCNLSPDAACTAWKSYLNPVKAKYPELTIIGPSVTNGPNGLDWLSHFYDVCPDAVVHANNIHFYDVYDEGTIDRFKTHVEKAIGLNNKPVWVTEFGLNSGSASEEQAASFLKDCMAYLDGNNKVQGYSYFMVGTGENQLNSGSGLSKVGQVYATGL